MATMRIIPNPSPNFDARPAGKPVSLLVLHYTGMATAAEALARLTDPAAKVSAHYMIDEDGVIYGLVDEAHRAWHAGVSFWAGETDINGISIGIELVNPGHAYPGYAGGYRPFPEAQMQALIALGRGIVQRHAILPTRVLGHSDVAPARKIDPGELFDWERLAAAGLGVMPMDRPGRLHTLRPGDAGHAVRELRNDLRRFGYGLAAGNVYDTELETVVRAFQRHYRRTQVDGVADGQTRARLQSLLEGA
jgi:N-acetylmuramoyl-L-alanine amidase